LSNDAGEVALDLLASPARTLRAVLRATRPAVVVNCAGVVSGTAEQLADGNVVAPVRLLAAMTATAPTALYIHLGSAAEYGPSGVRINAVSPGPTRTEGTAAMGENLDALAAAAPAGRPASPQEIADSIVFLASQRSSFVHGAILPVDGGRVAV